MARTPSALSWPGVRAAAGHLCRSLVDAQEVADRRQLGLGAKRRHRAGQHQECPQRSGHGRHLHAHYRMALRATKPVCRLRGLALRTAGTKRRSARPEWHEVGECELTVSYSLRNASIGLTAMARRPESSRRAPRPHRISATAAAYVDRIARMDRVQLASEAAARRSAAAARPPSASGDGESEPFAQDLAHRPGARPRRAPAARRTRAAAARRRTRGCRRRRPTSAPAPTAANAPPAAS